MTAPGGRFQGLFFGDYFARPSKRSGAWMTTLRGQQRLDGDVRPLVVNVMNFAKAGAGEPALLSFDDARTLFHEFGHALHGLLSDVGFPLIACTRVATRFRRTALPALRALAGRAGVLRRFARHYRTGAADAGGSAATPDCGAQLQPGLRHRRICRLRTGRSSNFHLRRGAEDLDPDRVRTEILAQIDMPAEIGMRHRSPHFLHVFAGGGYASGYYSYMWSEVLDADAFEAFRETGDVFDPATAARLRDDILAAGGSHRTWRSLYGVSRPAADRGGAAAKARLRHATGRGRQRYCRCSHKLPPSLKIPRPLGEFDWTGNLFPK